MSSYFSEFQKNTIELEINYLVKAIETKILPAFDEKALENDAIDFFKEVSDDYDTVLSDVLFMLDMKQDILNLSSVWLYHLFEKHSNEVFSDKSWKKRKEKLRRIGISISEESDFYKIDKELQDICNIYKHGEKSDAVERLFKIREDLFTITKFKRFNCEKEKVVHKLNPFTFEDLVYYSNIVKNFWNDVYYNLEK